MEEFSVCFSDPIHVDMTLFREWLHGNSELETAKNLALMASSVIGDIPLSIFMNEVKEQFVLFASLKEVLNNPPMLYSSLFSSLPPKTKETLVESYYEFDKEVLREILGKKMSAKLRKDMDDVSEKTKVSLQSCRRQFDNVKNIIKMYEEMDGTMTDILTKQFMFSNALLRKYLPLIFVFVVRFETSKKRIQYLSYDDIIKCAEYMMEKWTYLSDMQGTDLCIDIDEIDRHFVQELRDLRSFMLEKDVQDTHKALVLCELEKQPTTLHFIKSVDSNFKSLTRSLFALGAGFSHTKDFRDFFTDCVEKVLEPLKQLEWNLKDVEMFLQAIIHCWKDFHNEVEEYNLNIRKFDGCYLRYFNVLKLCLLQMYH